MGLLRVWLELYDLKINDVSGAIMAKSGYNTNLASEFYILSMLHRLGADAMLTLGNKKSVDITVVQEA